MKIVNNKIVNYYVYGFTNNDSNLLPIFQFETKSIKFIYEFLGSCDLDYITLEVIRFFEDGTQKELDVYKLRELYEVNHYEV